MRLLAPLLCSLAVTAACGAKSTAPIGNGAGGPMPTGPAPTVRAEATDGGDFTSHFESAGLPAVSRDGSNVVLAVIGEDGARGAPNLAVVVLDRADAEVHRIVVQTADDGEASLAGEGTPPAVTANLEAANQYLAETHAQRGWFPLAVMTLDETAAADEGYGSTDRATLDGVELTWEEGKVMVSVDGKVVVDRDTKGWTVEPTTRCDGCDLCSNPSFLGGAWIDLSRKLIVARIAYIGNDSCWEPDSEAHVVAWE